MSPHQLRGVRLFQAEAGRGIRMERVQECLKEACGRMKGETRAVVVDVAEDLPQALGCRGVLPLEERLEQFHASRSRI